MIGIVMGSASDLGVMRHAGETLDSLKISYEIKILSAHRTPNEVHAWSSSAHTRGLKVLIAAAGGAAHLAGVVAANTELPVLAVPMQTATLGGVDSLYSMVQMPGGIPVGTLAIGKPGAINAALFAAAILALNDQSIAERLHQYRLDMQKKALADDDKLTKALNGRAAGATLESALQAAGFKL